jgi:hypothetical protein
MDFEVSAVNNMKDSIWRHSIQQRPDGIGILHARMWQLDQNNNV